MCEDSVDITKNCTMITPLLSCVNYSYAVRNASDGTVRTNNSLTVLGDVYAFNFTEPEGDYIVVLCDGSTREVKVQYPEDDDMTVGAIILLPAILGIIFLIAAIGLGRHHPILSLFMFMLSPLMVIVSLHFGMVSIVELYGWTAMQETIGGTTYWMTIVIGVIFTYFMLYLLMKVLQGAAAKKKARIEF